MRLVPCCKGGPVPLAIQVEWAGRFRQLSSEVDTRPRGTVGMIHRIEET